MEVVIVERDGKVTVIWGHQFGAKKILSSKKVKNHVLRIDDETIFCSVVSLGNPHCVIEVDDVNTAPVEKIGEALMNYERFPEGVNVGFMQIVRPDLIGYVYERGAKETQAVEAGYVRLSWLVRVGSLKNKIALI